MIWSRLSWRCIQRRGNKQPAGSSWPSRRHTAHLKPLLTPGFSPNAQLLFPPVSSRPGPVHKHRCWRSPRLAAANASPASLLPFLPQSSREVTVYSSAAGKTLRTSEGLHAVKGDARRLRLTRLHGRARPEMLISSEESRKQNIAKVSYQEPVVSFSVSP